MRQFMICLLTLISIGIYGQKAQEVLRQKLTYYLPDITYDKNITSPEEFLGYQVGEWHVSHDQVLAYMRLLATQSPRMEWHSYAKSHEQRILGTLYISSPQNLSKKDEIKTRHNLLTEDANASIENLPVVIYQGYSIHGNEPSGINASLLVAYYLAAGQSEEINTLLDQAFIILDPCYNPDGVTRFSTWANSHKSNQLISDPVSREYNEMWPGGRTNHYWFDLNRDWLLLTHPESRGRVKHFQQWKPNILTDHHEMGTNSTFFFQPGVPSRVNPNTPPNNQLLTEEIATYHAKALDAIGSLYYTKEGFDDYYYGKGSTYPDIHGGVGILFEQASSRGHYQESINGILSFPFTIRNQVATSLSTQRAAVGMKDKLLKHKRDFYASLANEASRNPIKSYIIYDQDLQKLNECIDILLHHDIKMYALTEDVTIKSKKYPKDYSICIPLNQKQYKLVKTCFEKVRTFQDSIFYDVSAWTIPLAFDLQYDECDANIKLKYQSAPLTQKLPLHFEAKHNDKPYAIIISWNQAYAPAFLQEVLNQGYAVKTLTSPSKLNNTTYGAGSLIIPTGHQQSMVENIKHLCVRYQLNYEMINTGLAENEISLGHPDAQNLNHVKAWTIIGNGVSAYDVGELWHYMDHRLESSLTMVDKKDLSKLELSKYNTLILVEGKYDDISEATIKKIEDWIKKGNVVIGMASALEFFNDKKWIKLQAAESVKEPSNYNRPYAHADEMRGAKVLGGAMLNATADLTHPLCYGLSDNKIALFKSGSTVYKLTNSSFASPLKYDNKDEVILSGYVPNGFKEKIASSPAMTIHSLGNGSITCFMDNVLFRGYWWGGFRLFANALFFSELVEKDTKEGIEK